MSVTSFSPCGPAKQELDPLWNGRRRRHRLRLLRGHRELWKRRYLSRFNAAVTVTRQVDYYSFG